MKLSNATVALDALAQESRLRIFRLLVSRGIDGLPAGQVAAKMGLAAPTLSFHLSQLRHAGLINCRRNGRSLIYSANFSAMMDLLGFLTEDCCQGKLGQCVPAAAVTALKSRAK